MNHIFTPRRWTSMAVILAVILGTAARTDAILGVGDIVFDPSNYAQAIEQIIRLEQQTDQLIRSYNTLRLQYEQILRNARRVPVDMSRRYRSALSPWRALQASDTYGTTSPWARAANSGHGVLGAYGQVTEHLNAYGAALANLPADQVARLKNAFGTVELTDGANQYALETIGTLRANSATVETAIQALEDDALSRAAEMNTEVAVLNKLSAASLISVRAAQDANQLLVALAEQEAVQSKRVRDAEARAINQHVRFASQGKQALTRQAQGSSAAMLTWRMP
jgi:type IV secretion system protein TrbJ